MFRQTSILKFVFILLCLGVLYSFSLPVNLELAKNIKSRSPGAGSGHYSWTENTYMIDADEAIEVFNFKKQIFGTPSTLSIWVEALDKKNKWVWINGSETQNVASAFTWDWGDGQQTQGWFPQTHIYLKKGNYVVIVTSHYTDGTTDSAELVVRFLKPKINKVKLPENTPVSIPKKKPKLTTRLYPILPGLQTFKNKHFKAYSRTDIEYILTVAAVIQRDFTNKDHYTKKGKFEQVVLLDPKFEGAYALWFTDPIVFAANPSFIQGSIDFSSLFHEMGHNFTLNSPADFYYGGRIDGPANAIFSESLAQIYQHATAYEIINNAAQYGFPDDVILDLKHRAILSMGVVRRSFESYLKGGKKFSSWNNPATPDDETFDTFMTIAYKFFEQAERKGKGYRIPLKKMMELLQLFNSKYMTMYDQNNNSTSGARFRSTLMVAALANAFGKKIKGHLKKLNFPIDEKIYNQLLREEALVHESKTYAPLLLIKNSIQLLPIELIPSYRFSK